MDFEVRYGNPDGEKLHELETEKGIWFTSEDFTHTAAAHYWQCDIDRWQQLTLEARGKMLAYYRDKMCMTAYENKLQSERLERERRKSRKRGRKK